MYWNTMTKKQSLLVTHRNQMTLSSGIRICKTISILHTNVVFIFTRNRVTADFSILE